MSSNIKSCNLCPRNCKVDRTYQYGFCEGGDLAKVAKVYLHLWEEPCISGTKGSGTVFFSNCNLKCIFCQNYEISHQGKGIEVTPWELSRLFLFLQDRGAHNINLVTPTHYIPQIVEALDLAKRDGLTLPIVYNTNSYENIHALKLLEGYVDVYLPDFKYYDDKYAIKYSNAPNYFYYASKAIDEMFNQVGTPVIDENGLMRKGVIIRHLMLPGLLFDSKKIVDYIYKRFGSNVYLSIMNQYTPVGQALEYKELSEKISKRYYNKFIDYCIGLGIENAYVQQDGSASTEFIPDFSLKDLKDILNNYFI